MLEGTQNGKYHAVVRWCPRTYQHSAEDTSFAKAARMLFELAGHKFPGGCWKEKLKSDGPVFQDQVMDSTELPRIIRNQRQAKAGGMRGNEKIVCPNHRSTGL